MKNILLLFILFTGLVSWGQRVNIDELTLSNETYSFNGKPYDGSVYVLYDSGQLKEGFKVKNGKIEGKMTFYRDDSFVKERYKDTTLILQLENDVITLNDELTSLKKDSVDYLNEKWDLEEEIVGPRPNMSNNGFMTDKGYKWLKKEMNKKSSMKQKYRDGKLKGNKLVLWEDYLKCERNIKLTETEIKEKKNQIHSGESSIELEKGKSEYSHNKKNGYLYKNGSCYYHAEYDKNEKLVLEEELKDGVKNGSFKSYKGDVIVEEGTYSNGLMTGEWIFRHDNGNLKGQGNYVNGDMGEKDKTGIPKKGREGNWVLYHENGNISKERNYTNGLITGIDKAYYKSGKIWYIDNNVPEDNVSVSDGEYLSYYENGELNEKSFWKMGRRHGKTILFYENGNTKESGNYIEFKRDSLHLFYYENGELNEKSFWTMGKRNGKFIKYYDNGEKKSEYDYKLDEDNFEGNRQTDYNEDGSVKKRWEYSNGEWKEFLSKEEQERIEKQEEEEQNRIFSCLMCSKKFKFKDGLKTPWYDPYNTKGGSHYSFVNSLLGGDEYCSKSCACKAEGDESDCYKAYIPR